MKPHEKLLAKIKKDLPEVCMPIEAQMSQLHRVRGGDKFSVHNRIVFKWANFGVGASHVFSYETMTACLKKPIKAYYHNGIGGSHGWEISTID